MTVVLAFGTFDPLHDGHKFFLGQAAALGDRLIVVASRDSYIRYVKKREPVVPAVARRRALEQVEGVSAVAWGDEWPTDDPYRMLRDLQFDVLALGYDQQPGDPQAQEALAQAGRIGVRVVRLPYYSRV